MLSRVLEPEAMDTPQEAADYDAMDHAAVNRAFVADLLATGPGRGPVLDVGTGTALIPIEICRQDPAARVVAVELAASMLRLGPPNLRAAGLADRIRLVRGDAKRLPLAPGQFGAVVSNSLIHHLAEPGGVLRELWRVVAAGGLVFVRDLFRPPDEATLEHLVDVYAAGANAPQRQMLADSLRAALSVEEVGSLVATLGQDPAVVRATSDRHWTWVARKEP